MYVVFLGAPGAGKGTQAAAVAKALGLAHIATADMFREAQKQATALALEAKDYMDKGMLVPDEITIKMVLERISATDCAKGVIFDGFPRNLSQAQALDEAMAEQSKEIDNVVYIKVTEEELIKRINQSGIGPMGLGGKTTVLDVHVEVAHRHPASLPVGIAVQCWADRRAHMVIHSNGSWKVK